MFRLPKVVTSTLLWTFYVLLINANACTIVIDYAVQIVIQIAITITLNLRLMEIVVVSLSSTNSKIIKYLE